MEVEKGAGQREGGGGHVTNIPPGFQSSIKCRTMFKTTLGLGLGSAKSSDLNVSQKNVISVNWYKKINNLSIVSLS